MLLNKLQKNGGGVGDSFMHNEDWPERSQFHFHGHWIFFL